ncbi:MAG: MotA/TolQ/ExbB proton channel family protein [Planctomycetota bacterium]
MACSIQHLARPLFAVALLMVVASVAAAQSAAPLEAARPSEARSLFDVLMQGGLSLAPILVASLVMMVVALERFVALRRGGVVPGPFVKCVLSQIREGETREGALILCEENTSHIARVLRAGIQRWGKSAVEVEQAILDEGERTAYSLRRNLRVINGVAQVCPLLGLLGTVWGMMAAFDAIAGDSAMGRPELLAGGIGEALLSTASGLSVAIPALILYLYFVGRVDALIMEIDRHGQELVHLISAEAIQERKASGRKKAA